MKTYTKNTENRKTIVTRIGELTGEKLKYTMPHYTFVGQGFTVTREGDLEADEAADTGVIETLIAEGLILPTEGGVEAEEAETETGRTESPSEAGIAEEEENSQEEPDADCLTISIPLEGHTATSLRNLAAMLYSRGELISKATGGDFSCTKTQVEALAGCITVKDVQERIKDELVGMEITDGKIVFTGFPYTAEPEKVKAFTQLAAQMGRMAKNQKRTVAKTVDDENEKYIFRIWLIALGMKGEDFKTARRILLSPLSGDAAFKDDAMKNRWKEKRESEKAAVTAEQ